MNASVIQFIEPEPFVLASSPTSNVTLAEHNFEIVESTKASIPFL